MNEEEKKLLSLRDFYFFEPARCAFSLDKTVILVDIDKFIKGDHENVIIRRFDLQGKAYYRTDRPCRMMLGRRKFAIWQEKYGCHDYTIYNIRKAKK